MRIRMFKQLVASGVFCLLTTAFSLPAQAAVQVRDLYEIEVPVSNQGRSERRVAIRKGLADILIRLTGSQAMEQFGQMLNVLDRAPRYVEQFRYREKQLDASQPQQVPEWVLWIRFNQKSIHKLIREQHLPLWGSTRPETLVWVAVEQRGERYLLGADQADPMFRSVLTHARRRAVPILTPLLDLEDQRKVSISDIWGGFGGAVKKASTRYATENILIGRVYPLTDGSWESRWTLLSSKGERHWNGQGRQPDNAIAVGLDGLADLMAARYALKGGALASTYQLRINNIDKLEKYARSLQYLESVPLITRFQPVYFADGYALFVIDLRGSVDGLKQLFALEQKLVPDDVEIILGGASSPPAPLSPPQVQGGTQNPASGDPATRDPSGQVVPAQPVLSQPQIETLTYRLRQ